MSSVKRQKCQEEQILREDEQHTKCSEEEIFRKFLNHVYGEKVVVDELIGIESVMEMLVLAEKYKIKDMEEA